jgi:hypothetical protein
VENTKSTTLEVQGSFALTYMVGFIPLNLRSQEMDKGVPHARARAAAAAAAGRAGRGVAWRGVARRGVAWRGEARRGERAGVARRGEASERAWRSTPVTRYTRENTFRTQSSSRVRVFPSRDSARTEKREGRCLRSPCRSRPCTRDRQLGFWGASTRLPKVFFLLT